MLGRKVICGTTKPMFFLGTGYKQEYVAVFRRAHRMYLPTHHCVLALNMIVVFFSVMVECGFPNSGHICLRCVEQTADCSRHWFILSLYCKVYCTC